MILLRAAALLCALVCVSASSSTADGEHFYDLSGSDLRNLLSSRVVKAEWVVRPLGTWTGTYGPVSHTGVRVTLEDGTKWLVHKGQNYGLSSDTVVASARHMSSRWKTIWTRDFRGDRKTVSDFIRVGGSDYNLIMNCHVASIRMMLIWT